MQKKKLVQVSGGVVAAGVIVGSIFFGISDPTEPGKSGPALLKQYQEAKTKYSFMYEEVDSTEGILRIRNTSNQILKERTIQIVHGDNRGIIDEFVKDISSGSYTMEVEAKLKNPDRSVIIMISAFKIP